MKITIDPEAETDLRSLLRHQGQGLPADQAPELVHIIDMWGFRKLRRASFESLAPVVAINNGAVVGANVYRYVMAARTTVGVAAGDTALSIVEPGGTPLIVAFGAAIPIGGNLIAGRSFLIPPGWRLSATTSGALGTVTLTYAFVEYDLVEHCPQI